MGCVQSKGSPYSPIGGVVKLKSDNGFVKGGYGVKPIAQKQPLKSDAVEGSVVDGENGKFREDESGVNGGGNVSMKIVVKRISADEVVDGWPKWLFDNIPNDVLAGLVPRSADSYDKLSKAGELGSEDLRIRECHHYTKGEAIVKIIPLAYKSRGLQSQGVLRRAVLSHTPIPLGNLKRSGLEDWTRVGQGTYSNVYKARDRDTGKIVALKKVRFNTSQPESVKFMAREIIILQKLDHPNIIKLEGLAISRIQYSLYLVFDFMQSDLTRIISCTEGRLTEPQVKCYMQQLLSGLQHCHERGILHRDIKGSNLLIDRNGMLKIADFGLANFYEPKQKRPLTSRVVTLWYRAPELLLGSTDYGVGIDLWSAGCILAEMFMGRPIMPGRTEVEQLHRIFKLCGSPCEDYWKKIRPPTTFRPPQQYKPGFQEAFMDFPPPSFGLLTTLLALDPANRSTTTSALETEFFSSSPLACDLSGLPTMNKEEDMPTQSNNRKKTSKTKQRSQKTKKGLASKDLVTERTKEEESGSSKEEKKNGEPSLQSQDMVNTSNGNAASEKITSMIRESPPPPPSPSFYSNREHYARTEAHPNATKNVKNFPLIHACITESINPIEDHRSALSRRSMSTVDFRHLDMDKVSKLFGLDDH
ncbi:hypothetical protein LguiA_013543 [Lonicera macranthoides]